MRSIVLLGIGHTNAHVVREWERSPIQNCQLVCISNFPNATYSGMLPGTLAGQFTDDEMKIDLAALCDRASAQLIVAQVERLDVAKRTLHFADRDSLSFDVLSIGVGSMPSGYQDIDAPALVPIKPMNTFISRLDKRLKLATASCKRADSRQLRIAVVGGGVASIEIALCLRTRLEMNYADIAASIQIFTSAEEVATELRPRSIRKLRGILEHRAITVVTGTKVVDATPDAIVDENSNHYQVDCVIWATTASAPPILGKLGLPPDDKGFIATNSTLRTVGDLPIFAVGDSGTILDNPAPKAGVYAVRQAPILWHNLRAHFERRQFRKFEPQRDFLKLLNTGDGKALLQYKWFTAYGRWCWWLKTYIDKRFIGQFQRGSSQ